MFSKNNPNEHAEESQASSAGDGSKVSEENSDGLKEGTGDAGKNSKKRKHDASKDDFIESDTKEIVFKVKAGQTIKIINDDDNSSFSVTKKPGVEYSITSTSTSAENKTSRISFSFTPNEISKISSSVSNLGTIQFGAPAAVEGNSSTATIQITPPPFTCGNMGLDNSSPQKASTAPPTRFSFGNEGMGNSSPQTAPSIFASGLGGNGGSGVNNGNGSSCGFFGSGGINGGRTGVNNGNESSGGFFGGDGGDGGPSVYGPGAIVSRNNSTFTANGSTINGNNNTITGNGNAINGSGNRITGTNNKINGSNNHILGDTNEISGANNILRGLGNRATGFNNHNF